MIAHCNRMVLCKNKCRFPKNLVLDQYYQSKGKEFFKLGILVRNFALIIIIRYQNPKMVFRIYEGFFQVTEQKFLKISCNIYYVLLTYNFVLYIYMIMQILQQFNTYFSFHRPFKDVLMCTRDVRQHIGPHNMW